jgi:hypothetical protein
MMSGKHRTTALSLMLSVFLVAQPAAGADGGRKGKKSRQKNSRMTVDDNPLPRGTGKIVGGILTASIGGGLGLLVLFLNIFNYCGSEESNDDYASCERDRKNTEYTGYGLLIAGIGIGTPLIVMGAKDRREWKQWNRDNVSGYALLPAQREAAVFARQQVSPLRGPRWSLLEYNF